MGVLVARGTCQAEMRRRTEERGDKRPEDVIKVGIDVGVFDDTAFMRCEEVVEFFLVREREGKDVRGREGEEDGETREWYGPGSFCHSSLSFGVEG